MTSRHLNSPYPTIKTGVSEQELASSCPDLKIAVASSFISCCFISLTVLMDRVFLSKSVLSGQELARTAFPRTKLFEQVAVLTGK